MMRNNHDAIKKAGIFSWTIIGLVILAGGLSYALYIIRLAVIPLLFAAAIALILGPFIDFMDRRLPKFLAIIIAYLVVAGIFFLLFFFGVPAIVKQFQEFLDRLPDYISNLVDFLNNIVMDLPFMEQYEFFPLEAEAMNQYLLDQLSQQDSNIFRDILGFTNILIDIILILIVGPLLSIYLVKDSKRLKETVLRVTPERKRKVVEEVMRRISRIAGRYLRGRLLIAFIFGIMVYIGLLLLGIEFSYLFAFFAAVATLIPFFGALIGALPAVIAAFLVSPLTPLWVILLFVGLQLLENYVIEPFVMKEQIDLHPGLVIISIIAGSAAFGVIGLILSVPLAAVLQELLRYFLFEKKESGKRSS
jgi:predicted PurR-regulated permease PerM